MTSAIENEERVLTELRVRELAVIADVTLPLKPGLNVLTGATGAGKSILVDALSLLLGERASTHVVRPGAKRAVVEAAFEVGDSGADVIEVADDLGIDVEDDLVVVRREISTAGRNRAWVNGSPTSVSALATLGQHLVDLHGQHEAQSLLKATVQRDILDAFAQGNVQRNRVRTAYRLVVDLRDRESELQTRRDDIRRRADYLRHVVDEIETANLRPGEDTALDVEAGRLGNAEELIELAARLIELVESDDHGSAISALNDADRVLQQLARVDDTVGRWNALFETARANLEELTLSVRGYASDIESDPARLREVERRRDLLYRLSQKYGDTIDAIIDTRDESAAELEMLDTADLDLEQLAGERLAAEQELSAAAGSLTDLRKTAAMDLSQQVERLLPGLGLPHGEFSVVFRQLDGVTESGAEQITFTVQLNPGLDPRPLAQVASGGELSRLMLALKVVLSGLDTIPTLVFDEVDQGIGGEVAVQVADALADVAASRQVLVITHLPQIAARAGHHLTIAKSSEGGIATSDICVVDGEARVKEIARMLGDADGATTRMHAEELLKKRRRQKRTAIR
ncbi:MAG: DNA repair protein RecN [Gemmatimonadales bacterium]